MNLNEPQKPPLNIADVSGSATPNFLKVAVDELLTYRTPQKIVEPLTGFGFVQCRIKKHIT
jgi:hypothetical protein